MARATDRHSIGGNPFMVMLADNFGYLPRIAQAIVQVRAGTPEPFYDDIYVGDVEFSHRLAYAAAGSLGFTFFNVAESKGIIDLPGNGAGLPKNYAFIYTGCAFELETGVDINAANDADGAQIANEESTASATATQTAPTSGEVPAVTAEQIRKILRNGDVNLFVNGNVIDHFYGLHRAPAAGGPQIQVSMGGTTTAEKALIGAVCNNGDPSFQNRRTVRPQLITHNSPIKLQVDYTTLLALTSAGVLTAKLWGTLVKPRS